MQSLSVLLFALLSIGVFANKESYDMEQKRPEESDSLYFSVEDEGDSSDFFSVEERIGGASMSKARGRREDESGHKYLDAYLSQHRDVSEDVIYDPVHDRKTYSVNAMGSNPTSTNSTELHWTNSTSNTNDSKPANDTMPTNSTTENKLVVIVPKTTNSSTAKMNSTNSTSNKTSQPNSADSVSRVFAFAFAAVTILVSVVATV